MIHWQQCIADIVYSNKNKTVLIVGIMSQAKQKPQPIFTLICQMYDFITENNNFSDYRSKSFIPNLISSVSNDIFLDKKGIDN